MKLSFLTNPTFLYIAGYIMFTVALWYIGYTKGQQKCNPELEASGIPAWQMVILLFGCILISMAIGKQIRF
jgi:hypothetical protein